MHNNLYVRGFSDSVLQHASQEQGHDETVFMMASYAAYF